MRLFARILVAALAFILLIPFAQAQRKEKRYRFEFFGGVSAPLDKNFTVGYPQSTTSFKGTHEFSLGAQGGARIGMDGGRHWGIDYAYSYGQNNSQIVTPYGHFSLNNRIHQASSSVLFYPWSLERHTVLPYLTAGVGATFVTLPHDTVTASINPYGPGLGQLENEIIFAFNAGGGVRFRLNERYGIRLDARDYMSRPLRYGLPQSSADPNAVVLPVSGIFHQIGGSIGFVVYF